MSGEDDKPPAPAESRTETAPAYAPPAARPIDPWTELTPGDPSGLADLADVEELLESPLAPPALPGFADEGAGPAEVTGAEVEIAADLAAPEPVSAEVIVPPPEPAPDWAGAPEPYAGDGPFAAPVDGPGPRGTNRFAEALRSEPAPDLSLPGIAPAPAKKQELVPAHVRAELDKPFQIQRRVPSSVAAPRTVQQMQRSAPPPVAHKEGPRRHYPKMRALLADPEAVPYGIEPPTPAASPPVPGTFFPNARAPSGRPDPVDLDEMLLTMAEGLLIGESADGGTEVRVTLRDEFFAGTELRIALGDGRIRATLVPPDRDIYWQLNAHASDLEARLSDRGLRVASIEVREPGA